LSYTKAARELNVTQSGLTRSIQQVEERVGVRLFDRDRGGVRLTQVGRDFVARAEPVLRDADDLALVLQRAATGDQGKVSIGMAPMPAKSILPQVVTGVLNAKPDVRLDVTVREADSLLELLLNEQIDFFVSLAGQVTPPDRVFAHKIAKFPMSLVVRAGHPLLDGAQARRRKFPLVMSAHVEMADEVRLKLDPYVNIDPVLISSDLHLISSVTQNTDCVWFSSYLSAAEEIKAGALDTISEFNSIETDVLLYRLERRTLSPLANKIIRSINTLTRNIVSDAAQPEWGVA